MIRARAFAAAGMTAGAGRLSGRFPFDRRIDRRRPAPKIVGGLAGTDGRQGPQQRATAAGRSPPSTAPWNSAAPAPPPPWSDSFTGRYGEVVPGAPYKVNDTTCREYAHAIVSTAAPRPAAAPPAAAPTATGRRWADRRDKGFRDTLIRR